MPLVLKITVKFCWRGPVYWGLLGFTSASAQAPLEVASNWPFARATCIPSMPPIFLLGRCAGNTPTPI